MNKNKKETFITFNPSSNSFFISPKQSIHQRHIFINKNLNKSLKPLADDKTEPQHCTSGKSNLCN
jgi:hypothetical protein